LKFGWKFLNQQVFEVCTDWDDQIQFLIQDDNFHQLINWCGLSFEESGRSFVQLRG